MEETIGQRIKRFRGPMTQTELATRAEVSLSLIKKLETNDRTGTSLPTLHKLARGLDIDIADLVGTRFGMPSDDDQAGVVAIRRALTSVDDLMGDIDEETGPLTLDAAGREVTYAWGAYWGGKYKLLTKVLPPGIAQLRATAHAAQNGDVAPANELYSRMLWVTGCALVHLGQADAAFSAVRQALAAAEKGNDPLLLATIRGSVAWQLLVQGRYHESHRVALKAAASIEPRGDVAEQHLAVYGSLVLQGATAAGRDQQVPEALSLADAAGEVAGRIGRDTSWYECNFGPSQTAMQTVDIHVSSEQYAEALKAAKKMPNNAQGLTQVSQARHLVDKAAALARLGKHEQDALAVLLTAERIGGQEWLPYQTLLRQVIAELLDQSRQNPLRSLAQRAGVPA